MNFNIFKQRESFLYIVLSKRRKLNYCRSVKVIVFLTFPRFIIIPWSLGQLNRLLNKMLNTLESRQYDIISLFITAGYVCVQMIDQNIDETAVSVFIAHHLHLSSILVPIEYTQPTKIQIIFFLKLKSKLQNTFCLKYRMKNPDKLKNCLLKWP